MKAARHHHERTATRAVVRRSQRSKLARATIRCIPSQHPAATGLLRAGLIEAMDAA